MKYYFLAVTEDNVILHFNMQGFDNKLTYVEKSKDDLLAVYNKLQNVTLFENQNDAQSFSVDTFWRNKKPENLGNSIKEHAKIIPTRDSLFGISTKRTGICSYIYMVACDDEEYINQHKSVIEVYDLDASSSHKTNAYMLTSKDKLELVKFSPDGTATYYSTPYVAKHLIPNLAHDLVTSIKQSLSS